MKKYLIPFSSIVLILIILVVFLRSNRGLPPNRNATVYIDNIDGKHQIIKNGEPFFIKGAAGNGFVKELAEAGGNTLRVYDTTNLTKIFEDARTYHINIVVDIPIPNSSSNLYHSEKNVETLKSRVVSTVKRYKNHPNLLFWNLGNETNYFLRLFDRDFINAFNDFVDLIHLIDPDHPVGTTISGTSRSQIIGLNVDAPNLDLIGYNTFSSIGNIEKNQEVFSVFMKLKPYYLGEWGWNGPWEVQRNTWGALPVWSSDKKADVLQYYYDSNENTFDNGLGSFVFYWGQKFEGTPTWFNILDSIGQKTSSYYKLQEIWGKPYLKNKKPPEIYTLELFDSRLIQDSIFNSNTPITAELKISGNPSKFKFKWEIYREGTMPHKWKKLNIEELNLKIRDSLNLEKIQFTTPVSPGPYRLLVYLYDEYGNMSTSNVPFYILKNDE